MNRPNPYDSGRDSNAADANRFDEEAAYNTTDDDARHDAFTASALGADQMPTEGHDLPPRSGDTPSRFTYPWVRGPGGALAD
jgi:hypothetical protein